MKPLNEATNNAKAVSWYRLKPFCDLVDIVFTSVIPITLYCVPDVEAFDHCTCRKIFISVD